MLSYVLESCSQSNCHRPLLFATLPLMLDSRRIELAASIVFLPGNNSITVTRMCCPLPASKISTL